MTVQVPASSATTFTTEPFTVRRTSTTGLVDGPITVQAIGTSGSGDQGAPATGDASKDTVGPAAPSVTAPNASSANQSAYVVKGVTDPDASVLVSADDDGDGTTDPVSKAVTADSDGNYSATLNVTVLDDGALFITATASDPAGNAKSTPLTRTKDTTAPGKPTGTMLSPDPIGAADAKTAKVTGSLATADVPQYSKLKVVVTVTDGNTVTSPVTVSPASDGSFSAPVDVTALADGLVTATATVQDQAGNRSAGGTDGARKDTVTLAPVSTAPANGGTVRSAGLVSATYNEVLDQGSSTVQVRDAGGTLLAGAKRFSDDGKTIIFDASQAFSDAGSPYTATFTAHDLTSETTTTTAKFTVDQQAAPSVTVPEKVDSTNQGSYVVSGLAEKGAALAVTVTDSKGQQIKRSATAGDDGSYATAPFSVASLADGQLDVSVVATYVDKTVSKPGTASSSKGVGPADLVAVTGADGRLYARTTPGAFGSLGGTLKSAPAIVRSGSTTYYVGVGSNNNVYIRSQSQGFKAIGPSGTSCASVSAGVSGTVLAVACRATSGHLLVGKTTLPSGQLPAGISKFNDLGGALLAGTGPSVALQGSSFRYVVTGTNNAVYARTDSTGFSRLSGAPTCYGSPTVNTAGIVLACVNGNTALQVRKNGGTTYSTIAGAVRGRVGVASGTDGSSRYYVVGSNGRIYQASQSAAGATSGFTAGPGSALTTAGISAVNLSS